MQNKNITVVLVIVILLALGVVTYWFLQRGKTPVSTSEMLPSVPEIPTGQEVPSIPESEGPTY